MYLPRIWDLELILMEHIYYMAPFSKHKTLIILLLYRKTFITVSFQVISNIWDQGITLKAFLFLKGAQNTVFLFLFFTNYLHPDAWTYSQLLRESNKRKDKGIWMCMKVGVYVCVQKRDREGGRERNTMLMETFSFLTHWVLRGYHQLLLYVYVACLINSGD